MTAYIKVNSTYREVPNASLFAKKSSSYTGNPILGGYVKVGGSYRQFHSGSDAVTYVFVANGSKGARGTTWKNSGNLGGAAYPQVGRYVSGYPWFGLVSFLNDTSSVSLTSRLKLRPVVKSAFFNIQRAEGGLGPGYGNLYLGRYTGSYTALSPSYTYCNFTYKGSRNWSGVQPPSWNAGSSSDNFLGFGEQVGGDPQPYPDGFPAGGIELGNNRQQLVDHLKTGAMCLSHTTNISTSTGGLGHNGTATQAEQYNYWNFQPAGALGFGVNVGPMLIVTLDYV